MEWIVLLTLFVIIFYWREPDPLTREFGPVLPMPQRS